MLSSILDKKICAKCQLCCEFDDTDVWDAPGATREEMEKIMAFKKVPCRQSGGLWYFEMERNSCNDFVCPFLTEKGCGLGSIRPFKCALWPLYVVSLDGGLALAVSDVCTSVWNLSDEEILKGIAPTLPHILETVEKHPHLVEACRENFRVLTCL